LTPAATTVANYRRRWLQFSLRGLLLLMVAIALPLGWTMNDVRRQRIPGHGSMVAPADRKSAVICRHAGRFAADMAFPLRPCCG